MDNTDNSNSHSNDTLPDIPDDIQFNLEWLAMIRDNLKLEFEKAIK